MNALVCDISRYQARADIDRHVDFVKMKQAGASGVIIRSTVGNYYTDPEFAYNYLHAKEAGLLVGIYHVVAPENSPRSQLDRLYGALKGGHTDFPLVLDCELTRGCSAETITSVIQNMVKQLEQHGDRVMIYTRQSWWDAYVLAWSKWTNYPLHVARYAPDLSGPWSDGKCKPRDWRTWTLWQYSADGNGRGKEFGCQSASVDLNWFNGSVEQLYQFCNVLPPEPPAPPKACGTCNYPLQDAWNYCPMDGVQWEAQG